MNPDFDDLVGTEATGAERERLRRAHELLLEAGPPHELTPALQTAPNVGARVARLRRREVKRRSVLLLAAALSIAAVFAAGYAVARARGGGGQASPQVAARLALVGTSAAPHAQGTLEVWRQEAGNWPMTLSVAGLPKYARYEVYLVRDGRPWGSCGGFRVGTSSGRMTLPLTAPYKLRKGDSWIVTRLVHGTEPGQTVLRPVVKA